MVVFASQLYGCWLSAKCSTGYLQLLQSAIPCNQFDGHLPACGLVGCKVHLTLHAFAYAFVEAVQLFYISICFER